MGKWKIVKWEMGKVEMGKEREEKKRSEKLRQNYSTFTILYSWSLTIFTS
jgi:hypothetical protein